MLGAFILPESPKFLITRKRFDEARAAISYIGRINGLKEPFTDTFDREITHNRIISGVNQSTMTMTILESDGENNKIRDINAYKSNVDALLSTPKP